MQKLKVSDNSRFLVREDGTPFVWIGDTLWLWNKFTLAETHEYACIRRNQSFTIVQVRLAGRPGDSEFTPECEPPFLAKNTYGQWALTAPNPKYWTHMDGLIETFAEHRLYVAPVLMWGHRWLLKDRDAGELYKYSKWVGHRYRDANHIVWLTLGEGNHGGAHRDKVMATIDGLREGDTGNKLLTIHAAARMGTSVDFHHEVDFNTWQTSQWCAPTDLALGAKEQTWWKKEGQGNLSVWDAVAQDIERQPAKPVLDAEAWYEGPAQDPPAHVQELDPKPREFGQGYPSQAYHVRRRAYFTVFAGAFGHTYGADGLWTVNKDKAPHWRGALDYPGGNQMRYLGQLVSSRPVLTRIPDQSMIVAGQADAYDSHIQATRDVRGRYAFVYVADGHAFSLNLSRMASKGVEATWFNPRDGTTIKLGTVRKAERVSFDPPGMPHYTNDWVLILDAV